MLRAPYSLFVSLIFCSAAFAASVTFSGTLYDTTGFANGVISADLNRDGFPDIAVAGGSSVSVFLATSPGKFGAEVLYTVPGPSDLKDVLAADFNGDGALDLIVRHEEAGQLSFLWNNGDGTFRNGPTLKLGAPVTSFDIGDFNHDGFLDIATIECSSSFPTSPPCSVNVYLGHGNGIFTKLQTIQILSASDQLSVADMNGDGQLDVVISRGRQVLIFWGRGNGTLTAPTYLNPPGGSEGIQSFAIADFNNDGKLDLVVQTGTNLSHIMGCLSLAGRSSSYKNMGGKRFSLVWTSQGGCANLSPIDLNGDLNQDLIFQNGHPEAGFFSGLLGNGDGKFRSTPQSFPNQVGGPMYVRDMDLDSRDDYVLGAGLFSEFVVALQTGGFKNCIPPSSRKLAAKICTPASGKATSPVLVRAAGNSPAGVIQLQVWIDGAKKAVKWHDQLANKFSLSSGTHRITVIATDKYLGTAKASMALTVQ